MMTMKTNYQVHLMQVEGKETNMKELILLRGLPGSGKSTFAKSISHAAVGHIEADMFFMKDWWYKNVYDTLSPELKEQCDAEFDKAYDHCYKENLES